MRLDIQQLLAEDGGTLGFDFILPLGGDFPDFCGGTATVGGNIVNHGGYMWLSATVSVAAQGLCSRCGVDFPVSLSFAVQRPVAQSLAGDGDDEYILADDDGFVDLDTVFYEELLLQLPTKLLCKEYCKGLCPKCGQNLNSGSCSCTHKEVDPRLEVLKALLENG